MSRHAVCQFDDLPDGEGREFVVADRIVAVYRVGEDVHAIDGICAHAGGPLGEGRLDGCIVTCPWHGWQYDVRTGHHSLSDQIQLQRFPVEVTDGTVYVHVE